MAEKRPIRKFNPELPDDFVDELIYYDDGWRDDSEPPVDDWPLLQTPDQMEDIHWPDAWGRPPRPH